MTHNLNAGAVVLSFVSGISVAVQDIPGLEIADRVGMAGTAIMVVWWMLNSFTKRLDSLTEAIDRLSERAREKD